MVLFGYVGYSYWVQQNIVRKDHQYIQVNNYK